MSAQLSTKVCSYVLSTFCGVHQQHWQGGANRLLTEKNRQIKDKLIRQAQVKKGTISVSNDSRLRKIELINSSLLVILTILAFVVNWQLSSVQKTLIEKQTASEVQKFWSEVEKTVDKSSTMLVNLDLKQLVSLELWTT
ncbi:hypothetical protein K08M3_17960 [Vibrio alginolyticus]|jgi:hypothetical protein|uniref:Uncharacterized protein n=3 Tax=Vibrio TaxID=662 RepID=A0A1W6TCN4_VIBAL|nr:MULTISPECIES: hypothetical protein [Vibrio]ARO98734.1 hypothetical protein K01M1_17930 [Vibrio alginolyticus]ARP03451.1 hypothetical protein K04M1_18050 [Vibrio alginolyticus]ARP08509.1 hypothetical protein K04M3_18080 [Vibrio alginolyticus]ARP13584.1 hypothetical protein K04M5_17960 [Vibrio alginolyticus]ARP18644.1 hypothetical protein K05K4_18100 [Vibrio alginolyticus]